MGDVADHFNPKTLIIIFTLLILFFHVCLTYLIIKVIQRFNVWKQACEFETFCLCVSTEL